MSFRVVAEKPSRPNRSELAVPATSTALFAKAAASATDVVFLDLEDAVAPSRKAEARRNAIAAINDIDWGTKLLSVRINGLDTPYMYRDVIDVLEQAGERLDFIMIPKAGNASDIYALDMLVTQIETAKARRKRVGFEVIIETAQGMSAIGEIAAASPRVESLHFGVGDYSLSLKANGTQIGGANPAYSVLTDRDPAGTRERHWNDMWHHATSRVLVAARAHGLRAIDGPFANYGDGEAYGALARSAAAMGFDGKWAIHPSQIAHANEAFTPSAAEIEKARSILARMEAADADGRAAIGQDGTLLDIASIKQARVVLQRAGVG